MNIVDRTSTFQLPSRCVRPRTVPVRGILLHHTGAENPVDTMINTLKNRRSPKAPDGLSVHYHVSQTGIITQLAELDLVCLHGGRANDWTVGIEITNKGTGYSHSKWPREAYTAVVNRRPTRYLKFYDPQVEAVHWLCSRLCETFLLPWEFPKDVSPRYPVRMTSMSEGDLMFFRGILGHYHITATKPDPGPWLLETLKARGPVE